MTSYNKHLPVIRSIVTMTGCRGGTVTMTGCCSGVDTIMTIPVRYVIDFSNPGLSSTVRCKWTFGIICSTKLHCR
ncbi:uncharacterized protein BKA55DRAFT_84581 [Fusarium redolens]|uniref:Uncharacterized protein n=1 Tax=Fusarium redolens TaxID=48865 RepID=A0A9P9K1B2_FUSRE|nr:uncharacterized protein BKA55DRAFT_84581 [Fusarium redolens]KAH7244408.1 hypothetical protein BKA55DRAFT_84581 [Fusarium redolens]